MCNEKHKKWAYRFGSITGYRPVKLTHSGAVLCANSWRTEKFYDSLVNITFVVPKLRYRNGIDSLPTIYYDELVSVTILAIDDDYIIWEEPCNGDEAVIIRRGKSFDFGIMNVLDLDCWTLNK